MININEQKIKDQLKNFDSVWRRVSSGKSISAAAEERGVKLMPQKNCRKNKGRRY